MSEELMQRELAVLRLVAAGKTTKDIAELMHLAPKTVEHMLSNEDPIRAIYPKIGVTNRAGAAAWYIEHYGAPDVEQRAALAKDRLLEVYTDYAKRIQPIRLSGRPRMAIEMAAFADNALEGVLQEDVLPEHQEDLLKLQAQVLTQQGIAVLETSVSHKALPNALADFWPPSNHRPPSEVAWDNGTGVLCSGRGLQYCAEL